MWYIHNIPYNGILFSHKKERSLKHATTWMNLGNIMLNEISHIQKAQYCSISFTCLEQANPQRPKVDQQTKGCQELGVKRKWRVTLISTKLLFRMRKTFWNQIVVTYYLIAILYNTILYHLVNIIKHIELEFSQQVKDPALSLMWVGCGCVWFQSLAWELLHAMGVAKKIYIYIELDTLKW